MKLSILDPVIIAPQSNVSQALQDTIALAKHVENLGYTRYWLAEHHGVHYEATASPEILVSAIINNTKNIKVGVGGFLLNNYSPYKIAEIIKTLNALYPDRLDFGIGKASSGELADYALTHKKDVFMGYDHNQALHELLSWLGNEFKDNPFAEIPIMRDLTIPANIWLLAVSEQTATLAAELGLNLACSAFHEPEKAPNSLRAYYHNFKANVCKVSIDKPKALLAVRLIVADTQEEAERLAMPLRYMFIQRRQYNIMPQKTLTIAEAINLTGQVLPAEDSLWPMYVIGDKKKIYKHIKTIVELTGTDEIMIQDVLPDFKTRQKMYTTLAEMFL